MPIAFPDMLIAGAEPEAVPAKFVKAMATVAMTLHQSFDAQSWIPEGKSKESCILASLAVRDFLWKKGFSEASVVPVYIVIRATDVEGNELHSLGCGDHSAMPWTKPTDPVDTDRRWSGHAVVLLPKLGWLVDTTLFQAKRPQWPGLPGMMAVPIYREARPFVDGLAQLGGVTAVNRDNGSSVEVLWLAQPTNKRWRTAPDANPHRRAPVVKKLVEQFGNWSET